MQGRWRRQGGSGVGGLFLASLRPALAAFTQPSPCSVQSTRVWCKAQPAEKKRPERSEFSTQGCRSLPLPCHHTSAVATQLLAAARASSRQAQKSRRPILLRTRLIRG